MALREEISRIIGSQSKICVAAEDVQPWITNADEVADAIIATQGAPSPEREALEALKEARVHLMSNRVLAGARAVERAYDALTSRAVEKDNKNA